MDGLGSVPWAVAAVVIVLGLGWMFKAEIRKLIDRTQSVKTRWIEATAPQQQESRPEALTSGVEAAGSPLLERFDNALLREAEAVIRNDPDFSRETDQHVREQVLVRQLAAQQLVARFEHIYAWIWGSQLLALQTLNSEPLGVKEEKARKFFDEYFENLPPNVAKPKVEPWVLFFLTYRLVTKEGDRYCITTLGREFLKYVIEAGYPFRRPY